MNVPIESGLPINKDLLSEARKEALQKDNAAVQFEEIFARHLVKELTKNTFKMSEEGGMMGNSNAMYREFINDALATELAAQKKLGMADLVSRYWSQTSEDKQQ